MPGPCPVFAPDQEYLNRMLATIDCQAQTIGQSGWAALAAPGSAASVAVAGALTIFVALFGYRMLYGEVPSPRDLVLTAVKIGAVLALATSWPAFRTLVYDVALEGPTELATSIGRPAGLPGSEGGLAARLQATDSMLAELTALGAGRPPEAVDIVVPGQAAAALDPLQQRPRWNPAEDAKMLGQARTLYLAGAVASYGSVRLIAGLLLALAPLFALFLLFDATRSLFEGWVRGVAGAALGAVATSIVLGVQLSMLEPWLTNLISARRAGIAMPTVPVELLATNLIFAVILSAVLIAVARVAYAFRIPQSLRISTDRFAETFRTAERHRLQTALPAEPVAAERARAIAIAEAVAASQRREALAPVGPAAILSPDTIRAASERPAQATIPLGQSARRRTRSRVSGGALRRDRRS